MDEYRYTVLPLAISIASHASKDIHIFKDGTAYIGIIICCGVKIFITNLLIFLNAKKLESTNWGDLYDSVILCGNTIQQFNAAFLGTIGGNWFFFLLDNDHIKIPWFYWVFLVFIPIILKSLNERWGSNTIHNINNKG